MLPRGVPGEEPGRPALIGEDTMATESTRVTATRDSSLRGTGIEMTVLVQILPLSFASCVTSAH